MCKEDGYLYASSKILERKWWVVLRSRVIMIERESSFSFVFLFAYIVVVFSAGLIVFGSVCPSPAVVPIRPAPPLCSPYFTVGWP